MSGHGLQETLDRVKRRNEKQSREIGRLLALLMKATPGETMLLEQRYRPGPGGATVEAARQWLDDQYAGAVRLEGDDDA
jgi:hypothetical protein